MDDLQNINVQGTENNAQQGQAQSELLNSKNTEGKTFTQEEVNKIVEKRLNRERQKIASTLNVTDPREAAIIERERAVMAKELRIDAGITFREEKLPEELLDLLDYTDKESCERSIELLRRALKVNVEAAVNKRLKGGPPIKRATHDTDIEQSLRSAFRI